MKLPDLTDELVYRAMKGSGPGGQHVNKTSTKVELRWSLTSSTSFSTNQKELLSKRLSARLTKDGEIVLSDHSTRSQSRNKDLVTKRLCELLALSLKPIVPRKKPKLNLALKRKRLEEKRRRSEVKAGRKRLW